MEHHNIHHTVLLETHFKTLTTVSKIEFGYNEINSKIFSSLIHIKKCSCRFYCIKRQLIIIWKTISCLKKNKKPYYSNACFSKTFHTKIRANRLPPPPQ